MSPKPPWRLPLCWLKLCGGRLNTDDPHEIWWECATCGSHSEHAQRRAGRDRP